MAMLCLQAFQFCMIKELKVLKKKCCSKRLGKSSRKFGFCRKWQVATENILRIAVLKKLLPCSVSEILTK